MDQRTLVERARKGDREAFAVLARAAAARLDAAARLVLRDPELARDAVQEALIRAWRDLPGLRDPDRFDAWIHRLVVTASIDEARRKRRRVIQVDVIPIDLVEHEDAYGLMADRDALDRALAELTPENRALVVLHYYVGLPMPEAAATLLHLNDVSGDVMASDLSDGSRSILPWTLEELTDWQRLAP